MHQKNDFLAGELQQKHMQFNRLFLISSSLLLRYLKLTSMCYETGYTYLYLPFLFAYPSGWVPHKHTRNWISWYSDKALKKVDQVVRLCLSQVFFMFMTKLTCQVVLMTLVSGLSGQTTPLTRHLTFLLLLCFVKPLIFRHLQ